MIQQTSETSFQNGMASTDAAAVNPTLNAKLQDATGSRLITRAEKCAMLNISPSTSERWGREGFGPRAIKIGPRRVGYRLADVLAFITAREQIAA
jgi:predicted DNA-binding transcriptional regulator AlpA